jgi:hypothetical protein
VARQIMDFYFRDRVFDVASTQSNKDADTKNQPNYSRQHQESVSSGH